MSEKQQLSPKSQPVPDHRLVIRGKLLSTQPLVNIKVLDKESGQSADVQVDISYCFRNLARGEGEGETSYTLLICISNNEFIEVPLTVPSTDARINRNYDLDLDQHPRKVIPTADDVIHNQTMEVSSTQGKTAKSRSNR